MELRGCGTMNCNTNGGKRNTISGNFVDTSTINRTLRLRSERGKTWVTVNIHNEITMPTVETKYEKNNIA
ncbi:hypothetical protein [Prevotella pallens]|uniref:hypothetical protein n=1 Tax=Prevotella pallens TaxID=60133 RepID=UPI00352EEA56